MSRNKNRVGNTVQHDTSPPADNGGGFSFVVPTEFVDLPSQGRFYPEAHPLHEKDSVEIKQMTAKEEDILTSRSLLKKGVALDRLIQSLIVDKSIDPSTLLVGDRNAIIVAARVSGYGNDYSTSVVCPACETKQNYTFDLNTASVLHGQVDSELEVSDNNDGTITCVLPKTQATLVIRLITGKEERKLLKTTSDQGLVSSQLESVIVSVNGDSSPQAIQYAAHNLPSFDSRHLRMILKDATPNIDLSQQFVCSSCEFAQQMEVPLTADFFWPDR